MFLGKRSSGIYFVEFFDEIHFKTRRVSTGTKNKKLAAEFLRKMELNRFQAPVQKKILLSQFEKEYLQNFGCNFSAAYIKSIKLSLGQLRKNIGDVNLSSITTRKAGLNEDIHFHSLRHSFASAMKGVPIVTIKDLLGHSSIVTTQNINSNKDFMEMIVTRVNAYVDPDNSAKQKMTNDELKKFFEDRWDVLIFP